ncbi:MAG: YbhB/YbcL family Raf kinase inhibitor-like protein [Paracoccaceae bacterium]
MSRLTRLITLAMLTAMPIPASAFEIAFTWDGLASCTSGNPATVPSPAFTLRDVPEGTAFIRFKLVDRDVPGFNHGGGVVAYAGGDMIAAGQFNYKQPCPPDGVHRYEWTAMAQTKKNGGKLAVAKAARPYPE